MYMAISLGGGGGDFGEDCVTWTTWKSTIVCQNNKRRVPKERLAIYMLEFGRNIKYFCCEDLFWLYSD